MELLKFMYENSEVEFEIGKNIMVNANEMAKIFDKKIDNFTRTEQTQEFIKTCIRFASLEENKTPKSVLFGIKSEDDLIISRQKSGTWMHRILALKFAAWLNPAFELWVYVTIDNLINQHFKEEREALIEKLSAKQKKELKRDQLLQLYGNLPELVEYFELEETVKDAEKRRQKSIKAQISQLQTQLNF